MSKNILCIVLYIRHLNNRAQITLPKVAHTELFDKAKKQVDNKDMKPQSMQATLEQIAGEWLKKQSIYDIPAETIRRVIELELSSPGVSVHGVPVPIPMGPAAGPHTQLTGNLIAAWACGSRVFELKTVQKMDSLEIDKPCIDALDEGYNVEWSTELSLEQARQEYLKAWILLRILGALLSEKPGNFIFNMSLGYTLEGIQTPKMGAFIEGMRYPSATPFWQEALAETETALKSPLFEQAFGSAAVRRARSIAAAFQDGHYDTPVHSVTLSTMHGCPPEEMEAIGRYLLTEKSFDTYIKLNPTLLGYDEVRHILDSTGWHRIELSRETFAKDLQFNAALDLLHSLYKVAKDHNRIFSVKLSNTLANHNTDERLPGSERYMSGRPLFPITISLAAKLAKHLKIPLDFSYCGGISSHNASACLEAGLSPLTLATELLKPGGYLRLEPIARDLVRTLKGDIKNQPSADKFTELAKQALRDPYYRGDYKQGHTHIAKSLPVTDCFAAPCVSACPAHQEAPRYIKAMGRGESEKALAIILRDNPLPHITGVLCDHVCMTSCSRVDYEGPVQIRAVKLETARSAKAMTQMPAGIEERVPLPIKVAIWGAGPGGLACAHYLALAQIPVTVFDRASEIGGIPSRIIPRFRISRADIMADIERIKAMGVQFRLQAPSVPDWERLQQEGYTALVLATGATRGKLLELKGDGIPQVHALDFLEAAHVKNGSGSYEGLYQGLRSVVVVGGGNTAMDAARIAIRLPGKPAVHLLYRRSLDEMPADREEFQAALADGVQYHPLSLPEEIIQGGTLRVRNMRLGQRDDQGRRRPEPTNETWDLPCDLIISAIGELPDTELFTKLGIPLWTTGPRQSLPQVDEQTMESPRRGVFVIGDARRGPASIISAEADGRDAAFAILRQAGLEPERLSLPKPQIDREALSRRGEILESLSPDNPDFAEREAARCLSCGSACLRCVEVCPNRANIAIPVPTGGASPFSQGLQIIHIDDLCNQCGNCGFFCPYEGKPYEEKSTLFSNSSALEQSTNPGFAFIYTEAGKGEKPALLVRTNKALLAPAGPEKLDYKDWQAKTSTDPIIALAWQILKEHPYLLSGQTRQS